MDNFEDIPPELAELDERLRANRPVADGPTLDRVMSRAQRGRSQRSFFSRSGASAPRPYRHSMAVAMATMVAIVGSIGMAATVIGVNPIDAVRTSAPSSSPSSTGGSTTDSSAQLNAASSQYCPPLETLEDELKRLQNRLKAELAKPEKQQDQKLIRQLRADIRKLEQQIKTCYG